MVTISWLELAAKKDLAPVDGQAVCRRHETR
jgi:hypothetical protein